MRGFLHSQSNNSKNVKFVKHLGTRPTKVLGGICPGCPCGSAYELYRNRLWQRLSYETRERRLSSFLAMRSTMQF